MFQRIHKPCASNLPAQKKTSPPAPRPFALQALPISYRSPSIGSRKQAENEAFGERKSEVTGLPDRLKAGVELLSGMSMDDVRVHKNSSEPVPLHAHAYTLGTDIHLATGQERHLPHEAWHVVQQKQGRVKPTAVPFRGASINDDPGLEREADRMGARAAKAQSSTRTRYIVPAGSPRPGGFSGFRSWTRVVSGPAPQPVMQRKKVPTGFGEFETTNFKALNGKGVEIDLKFSPAESKVDAKKIALSQSIKTEAASGDFYPAGPNAATRMVASGKSGAGYAIDAPATTNNPIYYGAKNLGSKEGLENTPLSRPSKDPSDPQRSLIKANYQLGYCYKEKPADASKKTQPASLYDGPQGRGHLGDSQTFETAAFAIEGTDKDKYYGSVKWGYKMEGTAKVPTVAPADIELASKGTPTVNFTEPAKLWNAGKTQGTLQVTADPEARVVNSDLSGYEKLAKGTKLRQIDAIAIGNAPGIKAEVLKADGTGSGKIIYVKNSDIQDMGDGSPNKKLPVGK